MKKSAAFIRLTALTLALAILLCACSKDGVQAASAQPVKLTNVFRYEQAKKPENIRWTDRLISYGDDQILMSAYTDSERYALMTMDASTGNITQEFEIPDLIKEQNGYFSAMAVAPDQTVWICVNGYGPDPAAAAPTQPQPEPKEPTEPETTAEPEISADPAASAEPEATAEPESAVDPAASAEPEAAAEPESAVESEATAEPNAELAAPEADVMLPMEPDYSTYREWNYLYHYDANGKIAQTINLDDYIDRDAGEYFYAYNMIARADGTVITLVNQTIWVFDENGLVKKVKPDTELHLNDLFELGDGRLLVGTYEAEYKLYEIDPNTFALSEESLVLPGMSYDILGAGEGSTLYLSNEQGLSTYDIDTGEVKEYVNWINSDIEIGSFYNFIPLKDGRFFATGYDHENGEDLFVLLSRVPDEEVVPKIVISMGMVYTNYELRRAVIAYNRQSNDYRITIKSYEQYNTPENYDGGLTRFNNDLIAGDIPDLIVLDSRMPFESYAAKELFEDLYTLMDKDESFNRADYLESIMAALSTDGKLYRMCTAFSVSTLMAAASRVGAEPGWTMQEMMQALNQLGNGATLFPNQTRETLEYEILQPMLTQFVDSATGRCSFDSQEFIDLITYIASAPAVSQDDMAMHLAKPSAIAVDIAMPTPGETEYISSQTLLRTGKALLTTMYFSHARELIYARSTFGEEPTLIGYPSSQGNGGRLSVDHEIAISASSKSKDVCWDFIKFLLSEERQDKKDMYMFPVHKNTFEKYLKEGMHGYIWVDENGVEHEDPLTYWDDASQTSKEMPPLTEQEVAQLSSYIQNITELSRYDEDLMAIVTEELAYFYEGKKDAASTAQVIQSRAQTYINETR